MDLVTYGTSVAADVTAPDMRRAVYHLGAAAYCDRVLLSWAAERAAGGDGHGASATDLAYSALIERARSFVVPVFPVSGKDAASLGQAPGPEMGRVLAAAEAWWLAGDFTASREDVLARLGHEIARG